MPAGRPPARPVEKSRLAFRTISEVSAEIGVQQHVLRFWETRFPQIEPVKRGGNRRYYRPADVEMIKKISRLLYQDGYTIKGVQQLLAREAGSGPDTAQVISGAAPDAAGSEPDGFAPAAPTRVASRQFGDTDGLPALAAIRAQLAAALAEARAL